MLMRNMMKVGVFYVSTLGMPLTRVGFNIYRYHAVLVMRGESKKKTVFCIIEKERYRIVRS